MKTPARIVLVSAILLFAVSPSFGVMKPGEKLIPFSLKNVDGRDFAVTIEDGKLTLIVTETVARRIRGRERRLSPRPMNWS